VSVDSVGPLRRGALMPLDRAVASLCSRTRQAEPHDVGLREAVGRVLADPIVAQQASPLDAIAIRDGWAVAANDVVGASSYSPCFPPAPPPWIEAGEPMPRGTDAVVPPDGALVASGVAEIVAAVAPGEGVRSAGGDAAAEAVLRAAGERVHPLDAALALATGFEQLRIRQARVRIVSLPGADAVAASGELVAGLIGAAGGVVHRVRAASRDAAAIAVALKEGDADLRVVVGGTGFGRADHAAEALAASGEMIAHGIAIRPGETAGCGIVGDAPAILVPGRLDAALAATLTVVLPCLDHVNGARSSRRQVSGPLTRKVVSAIGMTDMVLLRRRDTRLEPLAVGDLTLAAMAEAEAWLAVHPDSEGFAGGDTVAAILL
jgi:molybdopterin molybdotransferase